MDQLVARSLRIGPRIGEASQAVGAIALREHSDKSENNTKTH